MCFCGGYTRVAYCISFNILWIADEIDKHGQRFPNDNIHTRTHSPAKHLQWCFSELHSLKLLLCHFPIWYNIYCVKLYYSIGLDGNHAVCLTLLIFGAFFLLIARININCIWYNTDKASSNKCRVLEIIDSVLFVGQSCLSQSFLSSLWIFYSCRWMI